VLFEVIFRTCCEEGARATYTHVYVAVYVHMESVYANFGTLTHYYESAYLWAKCSAYSWG